MPNEGLVIDIRGGSGAGKSWVVRRLLEHGSRPIQEKGRTIGRLIESLNCAVVGSYPKRGTGGCDLIGTPAEVVRRIKLLVEGFENVVLEGLLVSHSYKRYQAVAMSLEKPYLFAFLDTPLNVCIRRIKQRRLEAGNHKKFDPYWLLGDWRGAKRVREYALRDQMYVVDLDWQDPLSQVMTLLKEGVTCPNET